MSLGVGFFIYLFFISFRRHATLREEIKCFFPVQNRRVSRKEQNNNNNNNQPEICEGQTVVSGRIDLRPTASFRPLHDHVQLL